MTPRPESPHELAVLEEEAQLVGVDGELAPEWERLVRVLEEGEFERVGGQHTIRTNARIIAATHRDVEEEVQKGNFREDLFYRLYVIPILMPSLKERTSDIPFLVSHFLDELNIYPGAPHSTEEHRHLYKHILIPIFVTTL